MVQNYATYVTMFWKVLRLKVCVFSVFVFCLVLFVFLCVSLFVFSCFCGEGWGTIFPQLYKSMEPRRWRYYCWIPRCGFPIPDSGFRFPVSRVLNSGFLWLHSGYQSPRFWIPQAKISRIPEPDSLTVELDFALTVCKRPDFHGAVF